MWEARDRQIDKTHSGFTSCYSMEPLKVKMC